MSLKTLIFLNIGADNGIGFCDVKKTDLLPYIKIDQIDENENGVG